MLGQSSHRGGTRGSAQSARWSARSGAAACRLRGDCSGLRALGVAMPTRSGLPGLSGAGGSPSEDSASGAARSRRLFTPFTLVLLRNSLDSFSAQSSSICSACQLSYCTRFAMSPAMPMSDVCCGVLFSRLGREAALSRRHRSTAATPALRLRKPSWISLPTPGTPGFMTTSRGL